MTTSACTSSFAQEARQDVRIGRGNALAAQRSGVLVFGAVGHGDRQPALAVVEHHHLFEQRRDASRLKRETLLFDHVQSDDAQIADVLLHQIRDVVVAHEQHVERHVLAVAHQLIFAAAVLQPAANQQIERVVSQSPGLLQGDLEA